jgi:hypothetical protein
VILSNADDARSRRTSRCSARRSTASTPPSRPRPTSRACRPSNTCSTRWAATRKTAARLLQPALRPDVGRRSGHRQQGVRQPRPRPGQPGLRDYTRSRTSAACRRGRSLIAAGLIHSSHAMKLDSYWTDSAPAFSPAAVRTAGAGGRRGSSAAASPASRRRWRLPARCFGAVLEAGDARGGGGLGPQRRPRQQRTGRGLCESRPRSACRRARAWYQAYRRRGGRGGAAGARRGDRLRLLRHGKLKLAAKPATRWIALRAAPRRLVADGVDTDVEILDAARVRGEVQSERFHGGLLYKRSGQMHMGRFAVGLATAARAPRRADPQRASRQRMRAPFRAGGVGIGWHTARAVVRRNQVLLATGASATAATAASAGCAGASCRSAASSW